MRSFDTFRQVSMIEHVLSREKMVTPMRRDAMRPRVCHSVTPPINQLKARVIELEALNTRFQGMVAINRFTVMYLDYSVNYNNDKCMAIYRQWSSSCPRVRQLFY